MQEFNLKINIPSEFIITERPDHFVDINYMIMDYQGIPMVLFNEMKFDKVDAFLLNPSNSHQFLKMIESMCMDHADSLMERTLGI